MAGSFRSVHLDDVPEVAPDNEDDVRWRPLRYHLGIEAFGTNAFAADAGERVIERHDELGGDGGVEPVDQQEMYVVVRGAARFTVGGETFDAPAGEVVFVHDPAAVREAFATQDRTLVLAVGGAVGSAFTPSQWERRETAKADVPVLGDG